MDLPPGGDTSPPTSPPGVDYRWRIFGLAWVVVVAFALRAINLDWQSFWLDEVDAIGFARADLPTLLGMFVRTGENGPLYYLLLRFWIGLAGTSEYAVRYLPLIAGVLVVPLGYAVGARLFDRRVGMVAAALLTGSPYLIWYSQDGKMYALVAALSLLSTYLLVRAAEGNRWGVWIAYGLVATVGFYIHLFGVFLFAGQVAAYLLTLPWHRRSVRGWIVVVAALTLPYLPLAVWQAPTFVQAPPMAHAFVPLPGMIRILFNRFSLNQEEWPALPLIAPFVIVALIGHWAAIRRFDRGGRWLIAWLWVPILVVFLLTLRLSVFRDRYLTAEAPAYLLLLAVGLCAVRRPVWLPWLLGIALALSATVAIAAGPLTRTDFRGAALDYLAHRQPGDIVGFEAAYASRPFLWYAPDAPSVEFPYTGGMPVETAEAIVERATAGRRRVWLVEHEEWLWDDRALVRGWLTRHGRILREARVPGVKVTLFELTRP